MARYLLSFGSRRPFWWRAGDPVNLILTTGRHEFDFDLVEKDLPPAFIERLYQCCFCAQPEKWRRQYGDEMLGQPIGVNMEDIRANDLTLQKL